MNEEALKYSFDLFVKDGYNGTIDDYKELIKTNDKARSVSYNLFTSDGYNGSDADFNNLMGIDNTIMLSDEELGKTNDSANVDPNVESNITGSESEDGLLELPGNNRGKRNKAQKELKEGRGFWSLPFDDNPNNSWTEDFSEAFKGAVKYLVKEYPSKVAVASASPNPVLPGGRNVVNGILEWVAKDDAEDLAEIENDPEQFYVKYGYSKDLPIKEQINQYYFNQDLDLDDTKSNLGYNPEEKTDFVDNYYLNDPETKKLFKEANIEASDFQAYLQREGKIKNFNFELENGGYDDITYADKQLKRSLNPNSKYSKVEATIEGTLEKEQALQDFLSDYLMETASRNLERVRLEEIKKNSKDYEGLSLAEAQVKAEAKIMEDPDAYGYGTHLDFNKAYDWNQNNWGVIQEFKKLQIQEAKKAQEEIKEQKKSSNTIVPVSLEEEARAAYQSGAGFIENVLPGMNSALEWVISSFSDGRISDPFFDIGFTYSEKKVVQDAKRIRRENNLDKLDPANLKYLYTEGQQVELDGIAYIKSKNGTIKDVTNGFDVSLTLTEAERKAIDKKIENGDSVYSTDFDSFGGSYLGGKVVGELITQIFGQKGLGTVRKLSSIAYLKKFKGLSKARLALMEKGLNKSKNRRGVNYKGVTGGTKGTWDTFGKKIPLGISKEMADAIIFQSGYGSMLGYTQAKKAALAEGMSIAEAEAMAHQTSLGMGILFALTTPISPRTGMYNKIFSKAESKLAITQLIKASTNAAQVKKLFPSIVAKAFNNKVTRAGAILTGEGVKELIQENVQQVGENLLVNRMVNESTGKRILKDTYSYEDFVNTSILSFAAGGLSGGAGKLMSKLSPSAQRLDDRQKVAELKKLSRNVKVSTTIIKNYGRQGLLTDKEVTDIISELNKFANNAQKMPSFLGDRRVSSELLKVIDIQDRINKLEKAKKNSIPGEQNIIEEDLKALKAEQETVLRETKEKLAESNKVFDEKFSTNLNGIVKFINKIARVSGRQVEMRVFESTKDFVNSLKQQGFSDAQIQKAVDSDGAFIGDGKIFINKEVARQTGAWTVASHEIIHPILNKLIGNALQQGVRVDELKKILPRKVVRTIEKKIAKTQEGKSNTEFITYLSDALVKEEINLEPSILDKLRVFFNKLLGRAGANPQLGFANGREVYNWLKEFSTSLRETGEVSQTAADAIISTGVDLSDAQTVGGEMDLSVNQEILDLTDALDAAEDAYAADPNNPTLEKDVELAEKALDEAEERALSGASKVVTPKPKKEVKKEDKPKVKKETTSKQKELNEKVDKLAGKKDEDGNYVMSKKEWDRTGIGKASQSIIYGDILNPLITRGITGEGVQGKSLQDFTQAVKDELLPVLMNFNPEKNNSLIGWINSQLRFKKGNVLKRFKKEADLGGKSLDVEAGETGFAGNISGDAGVIRSFADEKQIAPENLIKASKVISTKVRNKLASDLKTWSEANGIDFDFFNFGDVDPNITIQVDGKDVKILNEVLKELFPGVDPEKFLDSRTMFTSGEASIVLGKLAENDQELVELFINLLPRGAVMPKGKNKAIVKDANYGKSTRLDGSILKNFYNKGTERFTKKAGLTPFTLKDNIRYSDVHQAFGMDSSGNKLNYQRAKSGIVLASAYKMLGKLILNEVIRTDLGLTAEQQMNVGAGKGDLQFSSSINGADALYFDDESLTMFSKLTDEVKDLLLDFKGRVYTDRFAGKLGGKSRSKINEEYKKLVKKFKDNKNATLALEEIKEYKELLQGMSPNEQEENIIKVFIQEAKTNKDLNLIQVKRNKNNNLLDFKFEYFGEEYIIEVKKNVKARLSGVGLHLVESGKDKDGNIKYELKIDSKYIDSGVFTEAQLNEIKDFEENKIVLLEGIQDAIAEEEYGLTTEDLIIEKSKGKRVRILISDKLKALIFETKELVDLLYIKRVKKIVFPISVIDRLYAFKGADILNFSDVGAYFVGDASKNKFSGILPKLSEATTKNGEEAQVKMRPFFRTSKGSKLTGNDTKIKYSTLYQTASFEMNLAADQAALSGESTYNFQDPKQTKEVLEISKDVLQPSKSIESINVYNNANKINATPKGISVWDFDDTLAKTKSNVLYTMPDGTKGKLNAEEFAKKGDQMLEEGVEFDFSEFSKVVNGSKGPFFEKAMARNKKFGNKNVFILTARPANSANAIHEFLKGIGLNIPLENITGLANSSPQAKADWVVGKAAEGYNDFYFADDATQNVKAVDKALKKLPVKSKAELAVIKKSDIQFSMNTKYPVKWQGLRDIEGLKNNPEMVTSGLITIEDIPVYLYIEDGAAAGSEALNFDFSEGTINIGFDLESSFRGLVPKENVFKIFGGVINAMTDKIKTYGDEVNAITFSGFGNSRQKLYNLMAKRYAAELGWKYKMRSIKKTFEIGGDIFERADELTGYYVIYRPDSKPAFNEQPTEVKEVLKAVDIKSPQRSSLQFSKSMNSEFNQMIEKKSGIDARGTISKYKASVMGRKKGRFQFFIPPGAEDFEGLMYKLLDKGKLGEQQKEWFKKVLFEPFGRGSNELASYKLQVVQAVKTLKKSLKNVPKELGKRDPKTDYKYEDAVRVYLWKLNKHEIKGISESDIKDLVDIVKNSPNLKRFARQLNKTMGGYPPPQDSWLAGTITTDAINMVNTIKRAEFLETYLQNVDIIFSENNMNKLEAAFGESYVEALKDILYRMKTGRNRPSGANKITNRFMNWVNDSVATIMFFNSRSALLQTLSIGNFINWADNNPVNAAKAFGNQKQFWSDFSMLFNSDFLKSRRTGLKNDVNADEIANAAATAENKVMAAKAIMLKAGFLPTQMADSFAIAMGGASFYRNRVKTYMQKGKGKPGMGRLAAEEQAFLDFQEIAEATQQSSRPDRVSAQQASPLGRIILAFANTPMQYMRLSKKAFLDLKNGRGSKKANVTKIAYYMLVQNLIFSGLQNALFALVFDDDDDEITEKKNDSKVNSTMNSMADSILRGLGIGGAIASTIKNMLIEGYEQADKPRPDYSEIAIRALDISPPISSKIRKGRSAGRAFSYKNVREKMKGYGLDNPAYYAVGQAISASLNIPADRAVAKLNNLRLAFSTEAEYWQRISLLMGWSEWSVNLDNPESNGNSNLNKKIKKRKLKKRKLK